MRTSRIALAAVLTISAAAVPAASAAHPDPAPAPQQPQATPEQKLIRALGDHDGLVRVTPPTDIEAVCDEYLFKRFGIKTIVLVTEDPDVMRLARKHDALKRKQLAARVGARKWRRALNHAVIEAARRDIAAGKLRLLALGMPRPSDTEYAKLLKSRYHITLVLLGCIPPADYDVELYNMLMRAEIERHFGDGILARTQEEAHARWQARDAVEYITVEDPAADPNAR